MSALDGKVAFITGAARGQGRSHALTLAREGADIIAIDLCENIATLGYSLATPEDLATTVAEVERLGRRIVSAKADVRDRAGLKKAFDAGIEELGGVDIVLANAGMIPLSVDNDDPEMFDDAVAVNFTGVYNTVEVAKQQLIDQARGGAIVITSSTGGLIGYAAGDPGALGYTGAKTAVVGLMRSYALLLAEHSIRVNTVHPTGVGTDMVLNEAFQKWIEANPRPMSNALPVQLMEPHDVSNAILYLVSDAGRYVTGATLAVDAGATL